MFRTTLIVVALALGVTAADARTPTAKTAKTATTAKATTATKPKAKTAPKKTATKKTAATKKSGKKAAARTTKKQRDSRVPTRSTASNMPRGWVWPPSKPMVASGAACEQKLDELAVTWKPAEREGHIVAPITSAPMTFGGVRYTPIYGSGVRKMDCHLAVALTQFGQELANLGVREVHYGSIYRWSKVRVGGQTKNMLSRHALGLAMDIVSFTDDAGRTAYVAKDYKKDDALLLSVERAVNASGHFRLLLTPKNDPISHSDHFHLEANPDFSATAATTTPAVPVPASDDGLPTEDDDVESPLPPTPTPTP
ncbi:MAG: extensin family protein [Proteobacteria bacterium]|nr:extensin family protein [Pseudomonadota bacterium]